MVHGHQSPVGNNTCNSEISVLVLAGDKVLDGGGIEELDVGELQDLGKKSGCEQGSVLDNDVVVLLLVGNSNVVEELLGRSRCRGSHHHCREELSSKPGSSTYPIVRRLFVKKCNAG